MGTPVISLADPVLGDDEKEALINVIDSGWLTMGAQVAEFEAAFARLHDRQRGLAVASCTAALHLALRALGIGPGDDVLLPSLTFVATANAVRYVGARPVFVDIESLSRPLMALDDAERKVTPRTRAVVVVHYAGYLAEMPAWRAFADARGLALIEDAAHAPLGAGKDGLADASAFSFFSNKNMTTAEGGMLFMRDEGRLERARRMRSHGMTTMTLDRHRGHAFSYDVTELGFNYRMDELRAALGLAQLRCLRERNDRRRGLAAYYRQKLKALPSVEVPFDGHASEDTHLMPILLPVNTDRESVMASMRERGIQTSVHYPPIHRFTEYGDLAPRRGLELTEQYCARELTLPLHPGLGHEQIDRVVSALAQALGEKP